MANEFIARKGLIVLANGAKITGSLGVQGDINATGYNVTASNLALLGSASIDGDVSIGGNITVGNADIDVVKFLAEVSSSIVPDVNNSFDLGSGSKAWRDLYVSGTAYIGTVEASNINLDSITVVDDLTVEGNTTLGNAPTDVVTITGSVNTLGPISATSVSGSFSGSGAQITNIPNSGLVNSTIGITAGSGLSGGATVSLGGSTTVSLDTSSAHFLGGVKSKLNADGVVSSSAQIDVRNTTGIATIATTGSNTFTGVQTITDTTNSTTFADGALIVQGGVGIAKDVNISGSLTVTGLVTAVSMSTQYVTSSQYTIGTSRVVVNDDDLVRFAGLSVVDSGSTDATGSLLWDSLKNHWIYEREDGGAYRSAVLIAGPKNYGNLGDEEELVVGRIPVATGGDHIDTNAASSSIYIDFTDKKTYVEAGLYITGSVTSSVGFSGTFYGDGSNLTGIATDLEQITANGATTSTQVLLNGGAVIHGVLYSSGSNTDVDTGTEVIATFATGSYDAAHFDYVVKKSGNLRTGTVMAVWQSGTTNVEFTDTSTNDIGDTAEVVFSTDTLAGNVRLLATVSSTDWNIKTAVRAI